MRYRHWLGLGASITLGMIFLVSGTGKMLLQEGKLFETYFPGFLDFLSLGQTKLLYFGLPYLEIVIGVFLITGFATKIVAAFTSLLIAGFIASNVWFINNAMGFKPCGCLGIFDRIFKSQLSVYQSLYLDIGMFALLLIVLLFYQRSFTDIRPWFIKKK
jgi:uncharacterized membrane protein YphA (DoxX/SURF4 family)